MVNFEKCIGFEDIASIPKRATKNSAGYDFRNTDKTVIIPAHGTAKVVTGIKAKMDSDMVLLIYIRSSMAIKHGIVLANNVAVIDADFYNNESNEGNITFAFYNTSDEDYEIKPFDKVAQGVFTKYYTVENDNATKERTGGIGSTGN